MALDGLLIYKISEEIRKEIPARINKIYQISETEILFQLKTLSGKKNLIISCHSIYNRITLTGRSFTTPDEPSNFVMLLRKHLESAKIVGWSQGGLDRWIRIECASHNELGDPVTFYLFVELMGKYANLIFTTADYKILDALKRIPPFSSTRTIQPGAQFTEMEAQENKVNPFSAESVNSNKTLLSQFHGFSPLLAKEIEYRLPAQSFKNIMKEIQKSSSLYVHHKKDDVYFHCIPLTHLGQNFQKELLDGIDTLYLEQEEKERIRNIVGDIYKFTQRTLKHYRKKLPKLIQSYEESLDCEQWRVFGDLLYANQHIDTKGKSLVELPTWENDELIQIPLDQKLDIKQNAKKCFQTYNKRKKGQIYIQEQIDLCKKEITYFEGLEEQLDLCNVEDALEINKELIQFGYLQAKKKTKRQMNKKDSIPSITRWNLEDGTVLSFGKNNLQNDALTFKLAQKNDLWFHTKDFHGAHVTVNTSTPTEEVLRFAAMVAAYFSKGRHSSSVPVNYCLIKDLKKIPGAKPGMVSLSSYKTIYIDPDIALLEQWINKK
ncbi:MAG: NFACT family protein [Anaerorhabdus sp.]